MPQIIVDENDAMEALKLACAPTVDPVLDEANELLPILRQCVRAVIWTASTAYYLGADVQPTAAKRNGHRFKLIAFDGDGVSSGATEPSWPSWDNAIVTDGNCTWQEAGTDYACLWDLREATRRALDLKIQKAVACGVDFATPALKVSNSQLIANLKAERDQYLPLYIV